MACPSASTWGVWVHATALGLRGTANRFFVSQKAPCGASTAAAFYFCDLRWDLFWENGQKKQENRGTKQVFGQTPEIFSKNVERVSGLTVLMSCFSRLVPLLQVSRSDLVPSSPGGLKKNRQVGQSHRRWGGLTCVGLPILLLCPWFAWKMMAQNGAVPMGAFREDCVGGSFCSHAR